MGMSPAWSNKPFVYKPIVLNFVHTMVRNIIIPYHVKGVNHFSGHDPFACNCLLYGFV